MELAITIGGLREPPADATAGMSYFAPGSMSSRATRLALQADRRQLCSHWPCGVLGLAEFTGCWGRAGPSWPGWRKPAAASRWRMPKATGRGSQLVRRN